VNHTASKGNSDDHFAKMNNSQIFDLRFWISGPWHLVARWWKPVFIIFFNFASIWARFVAAVAAAAVGGADAVAGDTAAAAAGDGD